MTTTIQTPLMTPEEESAWRLELAVDEMERAAYMDNREHKRRGSRKIKAATHCLCGCGIQVTRRFKPGHDAALKGALIRAYRAGEPVQFTAFESTDPKVIASELGWEHFLTSAPAPRVRTRKAAEPKPVRVQAMVGRWAYEGEVRDGVFHYQDRQGNPLETTRFTLA